MNALAAAGVGLLGLALMPGWALWRQRRRNAALQRRLDLADTELQQLQQACARLAPAGVVDGVLAYFGALRPNPWQCADAVRCALAMAGAVRRCNEELPREGLPPLALGIGIHRGPGLAGMIGSRERREYGFVGRTVNLAARVQTLTRTHGVEILVTEAVRTGIGDAFVLRAMPAERVKGIEQPVLTWAVLDVAGADPAGAVQHP